VAVVIALIGLMIGVSKGGDFGLENESLYIKYPLHQ